MPSDSPLFSIVTVTLNCAEAARRTAESVSYQTFSDYEYVIKDGGSTDGTVDVLRASGVTTLVITPDRGIYDAMNQALSLCRGQYICFLNAGDTFIHRNVLQLVADYARNFPEVSFFYGDVLTMERHPIYGTGEGGGGRVWKFPDTFDRLAAFLISICQQSWFVSRDLFFERSFDLSFRLKADYDFFLFWLLEKRVSYKHIPEVLVRYAAGGQSEMHQDVLRQEHKRLLRRYYSPSERLLYSFFQRMRQVYRVTKFYVRGNRPTN
jgi:putative colanic acid biosynthesis glycosyltransferase